MYERFFGLADAPFRLTPDPRYLFLSKKHAEGLAHLKLSLRESSGFVCITGDVGTGKTTLLRAFLTGLGPDIATAYVFNPALSALELLQTINSEFGLAADSTSPKVLIDALNAHLLRQREAGRRSIVVIDEAQALQIDVLEQLRLLSNLETTTEKLLRIILVGQPQLRTLLLHPELVQLNQRITLRWHLGPLDPVETAAYVRHRLDIASGTQAPRVFTAAAVRLLHRFAHGVPRLVNMIAHRALLAAFAADSRRVTARFVHQAYREIGAVPLPAPPRARRRFGWLTPLAAGLAGAAIAVGAARVDWRAAVARRGTPDPVVAAAPDAGVAPPADVAAPPAAPATAGEAAPPAVVLAPAPEAAPAPAGATAPVPAGEAAPADAPVERVALAVVPATPDGNGAPPVPAEVVPAPPAAAEPPEAAATAAAGGASRADEPAAPPAAAPVPVAEVERRLGRLDGQASVRDAVAALLAAWRVDALATGEPVVAMDLAPVAQRRGLEHLPLVGNTSMLRLLDLPAVLELRVPDAETPRWVAVVGLGDGRVTLVVDGEPVVADAALLDRDWFGQAHLFWRDFEALGRTFGADGSAVQVTRLQQLLGRLGMLEGVQSGRWDPPTAQAVLEFQRTRLLEVDGRVGRFTRIVLYGAVGGYARPTLAGSGAAS